MRWSGGRARVLALVCLASLGTLPQAREERSFQRNAQRERPPHIVVLLQDDLGFELTNTVWFIRLSLSLCDICKYFCFYSTPLFMKAWWWQDGLMLVSTISIQRHFHLLWPGWQVKGCYFQITMFIFIAVLPAGLFSQVRSPLALTPLYVQIHRIFYSIYQCDKKYKCVRSMPEYLPANSAFALCCFLFRFSVPYLCVNIFCFNQHANMTSSLIKKVWTMISCIYYPMCQADCPFMSGKCWVMIASTAHGSRYPSFPFPKHRWSTKTRNSIASKCKFNEMIQKKYKTQILIYMSAFASIYYAYYNVCINLCIRMAAGCGWFGPEILGA